MSEAKKLELTRLREEITQTRKRLANLQTREAEISAALVIPTQNRPRTLYAE